MDRDSHPGGAAGLARTLRTVDMVLLYVAAIIGLRWLSTAAKYGPASVTLWVIALLVFFVPSALTVQELSSRIPARGRTVPVDHGGLRRGARFPRRLGLLALEPGLLSVAAAVRVRRRAARRPALVAAAGREPAVQRAVLPRAALGGHARERAWGSSTPSGCRTWADWPLRGHRAGAGRAARWPGGNRFGDARSARPAWCRIVPPPPRSAPLRS